MANVVLEIFDAFFFGMSSDVPEFKVSTIISDFEVEIKVK